MSNIGRMGRKEIHPPNEVIERRAAPRVALRLDARVRVASLDLAFWGATVDLGPTGMFLEVPSLLPPGTPVEIELWLRGTLTPLWVAGTVVRHNGERAGMGVHLERQSPEAATYIQQLCSAAELVR